MAVSSDERKGERKNGGPGEKEHLHLIHFEISSLENKNLD